MFRATILGCLTIGLLSANAALAAPIQFVVAELPDNRVHGDSFIVTIDSADSSNLQHARELVDWIHNGADPLLSPGATIVVGSITAGADGINRDWGAAGIPAWSWHVEEPISFADFTVEILDGWPTFVESDVPGWIANTNGKIGFWNYTIVEERLVPEPATGFLLGFGLIALLRLRRSRPV